MCDWTPKRKTQNQKLYMKTEGPRISPRDKHIVKFQEVILTPRKINKTDDIQTCNNPTSIRETKNPKATKMDKTYT